LANKKRIFKYEFGNAFIVLNANMWYDMGQQFRGNNILNRGKNNIPVIYYIWSCLNGSLLFQPVIVVQMNGNHGIMFWWLFPGHTVNSDILSTSSNPSMAIPVYGLFFNGLPRYGQTIKQYNRDPLKIHIPLRFSSIIDFCFCMLCTKISFLISKFW